MSSKKPNAPPTLRPSDPAPEQPVLGLGQPFRSAGLSVGKLGDLATAFDRIARITPNPEEDSPSGSETGVADATPPTDEALARARRLAESYTKKSGTFLHPEPSVTEGVLLGLGRHIDELKRPLCPCRFYPDKQAEIEHRTWICPCDDMQIYKYCHCLLFTDEAGRPVTEHLPPEHEGRRIWGVVRDPSPDKGRGLKERAAEREEERRRRNS